MTREHGIEVEEAETKRAKIEEHKKQRVERLAAEQEKMIRTIEFGSEEYHMDHPDLEANDEIWANEEELHFTGILCCDFFCVGWIEHHFFEKLDLR